MDWVIRQIILLMVLFFLSMALTLGSIFLSSAGDRGPDSVMLAFGVIALLAACYIAYQLLMNPHRN